MEIRIFDDMAIVSDQPIIKTSDDPIKTFTEYWTKKEAVFKLRGTGITKEGIYDTFIPLQ